MSARPTILGVVTNPTSYAVPSGPAWMAEGTCATVDPALWFPDKGGAARDAKRVCAVCPVLTQCREYAIGDASLRGVWGGLSERAREKVRTERRRAS